MFIDLWLQLYSEAFLPGNRTNENHTTSILCSNCNTRAGRFLLVRDYPTGRSGHDRSDLGYVVNSDDLGFVG